MSPQCLKDQTMPSSDLVCFLILRVRSKRKKETTFSSQKGLLNPNSLSNRSVPFSQTAVARGVLCSRHTAPSNTLSRPGWIWHIPPRLGPFRLWTEISLPEVSYLLYWKDSKRNALFFRSVPPTQCPFEKQTKSFPEHLVGFHPCLPLLHFMLYNYSDRDAAFSQLRTYAC